jgi:hypothetical protein
MARSAYLARTYFSAFHRDLVQDIAQLYSFRVGLSHVRVINLALAEKVYGR